MRRALLIAVSLVAVLVVGSAPPARAHDYRSLQFEKRAPNLGVPAPPNPATVTLRAALGEPAGRRSIALEGELTSLPEDPAVTITTPADPCLPGSCLEYQVDVPAGSPALYASIAWAQPSYYLHLWGIAPGGQVVGRADVARSYDKETGNERTIPRAQFTVSDPAPGRWRVQARAVFGYKVTFTGTIAVSSTPAVRYERLGVRELADRFATQPLRVNVVFVGRTPTPAQVQAIKAALPGHYRASVAAKSPPVDCDDSIECKTAGLVNWHVGHFAGTRTSADDREGDAGGAVPYFEALKWTYSYRFFAASEAYTRDLFGALRDLTEQDAPFDSLEDRAFLQAYNAGRGRFRGPDATVVDASVRDVIDAYAVEDWIFAHRLDPKYAAAFLDLETGERRDGAFITPDPGAYYDPFYDARGAKDLDPPGALDVGHPRRPRHLHLGTGPGVLPPHGLPLLRRQLPLHRPRHREGGRARRPPLLGRPVPVLLPRPGGHAQQLRESRCLPATHPHRLGHLPRRGPSGVGGPPQPALGGRGHPLRSRRPQRPHRHLLPLHRPLPLPPPARRRVLPRLQHLERLLLPPRGGRGELHRAGAPLPARLGGAEPGFCPARSHLHHRAQRPGASDLPVPRLLGRPGRERLQATGHSQGPPPRPHLRRTGPDPAGVGGGQEPGRRPAGDGGAGGRVGRSSAALHRGAPPGVRPLSGRPAHRDQHFRGLPRGHHLGHTAPLGWRRLGHPQRGGLGDLQQPERPDEVGRSDRLLPVPPRRSRLHRGDAEREVP